MANLFGLDIAGIVNTAIADAGGVLPGTLTRVVPGTRTPGSLTGGTNPTTTSHAFKGFFEEKEMRIQGQVTGQIVPVVTILGASVSPLVEPEVNDTVLIDGKTFTLLELLARDPASAVYEFKAEE